MAVGAWQRGYNNALVSSTDFVLLLGVIPPGHTVGRIILRLTCTCTFTAPYFLTGIAVNFIVAMTPATAPVYLDPMDDVAIVDPKIMWFEGLSMQQELVLPDSTQFVMHGDTGPQPRIMKGQRKNTTGDSQDLYLRIRASPLVAAEIGMFTQASYSVWVYNT